jgi:hypothetical protein
MKETYEYLYTDRKHYSVFRDMEHRDKPAINLSEWLMEYLNSMGKDGWQLIKYDYLGPTHLYDEYSFMYSFLFMRKKTEV